MASEPTFKRNQVDQALWETVTHLKGAGKEPPAVFRTRIKRLLEIDRRGPPDTGTYAFSTAAPGGKGVDARFSAFDTFCLAIGLELLDTGFKQSEVVFLLQHIRRGLHEHFDYILEDPPRLQASADNHPDRPKFEHPEGKPTADFTVFVLIQRVEVREKYPLLKGNGKVVHPIIGEPIICRGIDALRDTIYRKKVSNHFLLEISVLGHLVTSKLASVPAIPRGRG